MKREILIRYDAELSPLARGADELKVAFERILEAIAEGMHAGTVFVCGNSYFFAVSEQKI